MASQPQTQQERREQSERRLIEAAMEIAVAEGVGAVTFDSIGARAGYSRGLAGQKFGSKEGLWQAVIDFLYAETYALLEAAEIDDLPGLAALQRYLAVLFEGYRSSEAWKAYFIVLGHAVGDRPDYRPLFVGSHDRVKADLIRFLERGRKDGSVGSHFDINTAALSIGTMAIGIAMQGLVDPTLNIEAMADEAQALIETRYGEQNS